MADSPKLYVFKPVPGGVWDYVEAPPAEILSAARALEGAEEVVPWETDDDGGRFLAWVPGPGRYLIVPLDIAALRDTEDAEER